jgi:hypothetical protein
MEPRRLATRSGTHQLLITDPYPLFFRTPPSISILITRVTVGCHTNRDLSCGKLQISKRDPVLTGMEDDQRGYSPRTYERSDAALKGRSSTVVQISRELNIA